MNINRIEELKKLAHDIDPVLNLFDGFEVMPYDGKAPELQFWSLVNNMYYIFKDCDNFQISNSSNSIFKLFYDKYIISEDEYDRVQLLYQLIFDLRSFFCHNTNREFYYTEVKLENIRAFLAKFFMSSEDMPKQLQDLKSKNWTQLVRYLETEVEIYFDILKKALIKVNASRKKDPIVRRWKTIYAKGLYNNMELKRNIIADFARIQCLDMQGSVEENTLKNYIHEIEDRLKLNGFGHDDVLQVIESNTKQSPSGYAIVKDSIRQYLQ